MAAELYPSVYFLYFILSVAVFGALKPLCKAMENQTFWNDLH